MAGSNRNFPIFARIASLALFALLLSGTAAAQDIYKTVDENGNVVYTDQKPSDDAEPVKLRELTVVEPVEIGDPSAVAGDGQPPPAGLADINVRIVSPEPEETIWNTAYEMNVAVSLSASKPSGARLAYLIDGVERAVTGDLQVSLDEVWRGEHQVMVELRDEDGRVISASDPVTFYMRQASALNPPPGR